jgi:hypothetical protein
VCAAAGCSSGACNDVRADAIYVEVVDGESGDPVRASIEATRNGNPAGVSCIVRKASESPCMVWAVGFQQGGTFELTIEAEDHESRMDTVQVPYGRCGPDSQMRRYELARTG